MFCGKCGKALPEDAKFCAHCGNAVEKLIKDTNHNPDKNELLSSVNSSNELVKNTKNKTVGKSYGLLAGIAIIVILVIIAFWDAHREGNVPSQQTSMATETPVPTLSPEQEQYNKAVEQMDLGEYESAREIFLQLGSYEDAQERVKETYYKQGMDLLSAEKYKRAKEIFQNAAGYKDSKAKIKFCNYNIGVGYYDGGRYKKAKKVFRKLGDYMESKEYLHDCKVKIFTNAEIEIYEWIKTYDSAWDNYAYGDGVEYTVAWFYPGNADGYEVYVGQSEWEGDWYEDTFTTTETSTSVEFSSMYQLKACVRPYKYIDGEIVYGSWSDTQYVTFTW